MKLLLASIFISANIFSLLSYADDVVSETPVVDAASSEPANAENEGSSETPNIKAVPAIFIFDTVPSGIEISINGEAVGVTPYTAMKNNVGDTLVVETNDKLYQPYKLEIKLEKELTRPEPVELSFANVLAVKEASNDKPKYTKISATGEPLPIDASEWVCILDNSTSLMWEVKTDDGGFRDKDYTYSWYNTDEKINHGNEGYDNRGKCKGGSGCDTEKYTHDVNAIKLCGASNWRMPTNAQLQDLLTCRSPKCSGGGPYIDQSYFPNSVNAFFWSQDTSEYKDNFAWLVNLGSGGATNEIKKKKFSVRLVRNTK